MKNTITANNIEPGLKGKPKAITNITNNAIVRISIPLPKQHKHLAKSPCGCLIAITSKIVSVIKAIATIIKPNSGSTKNNGAISKQNNTANAAAKIKAATIDKQIQSGDSLHIYFTSFGRIIGFYPIVHNMKIIDYCYNLN